MIKNIKTLSKCSIYKLWDDSDKLNIKEIKQLRKELVRRHLLSQREIVTGWVIKSKLELKEEIKMNNKATIGMLLTWFGVGIGILTLLYSLVNDVRAAMLFIICALMAGAGWYLQKTYKTESWR